MREKGVETGEKPSVFKGLRTFKATPKPWVAGSNPPAPAITEAKRLRFFSFWCVLFCISLSKAEMTSVFNYFISKNSFSFSVVSVCSNLSVCHSIKKAATVSTQLQKIVRATANFNCCGSPFIFGGIPKRVFKPTCDNFMRLTPVPIQAFLLREQCRSALSLRYPLWCDTGMK